MSAWLTTLSSIKSAAPSDGKQSAWDKLVIAADLAAVKSHFCDSFNTAKLLASSRLSASQRDWLHALPLATCDLKLDEAIRIAVVLRFGVNLCELQQCPCGKLIDACGTHGLSCKRGTARTIRHHQLNGIVRRALVRANIPSVLEPSGLSRGDVKRPDGMTLIPWQGGKTSSGTSPSATPSPTLIYTSRRCVRAARRMGRPGERKSSTQHSTTRTPLSRSLSKPTDQSTTRASNSSKN